MLAGVLTALSLFGHAPAGTPPAPTGLDRYQQRFGGWTVDFTQDRFAERLTCDIHAGPRTPSPPARYVRGAFVFRLGAEVDARDAIYRVDGGAPLRADRGTLRLARVGAPRPQPSLGSESGGLVVLPADAVRGGAVIEIRPGQGARVRRFRLDGAGAAIESARRYGCLG